ncbi:MAG: hypothetical protein AAGI01_15120 [Myxococcota bacterium]
MFSRHAIRLLLTVWALMALGLTSCLVNNPAGLGPSIVSLDITPSQLPVADTGMTNQFFTIVIETDGFTDTITDATVTIQEENRDAPKQEPPVIDGSTITLSGIAQSWFSGLEANTYNLKVTVVAEDEAGNLLQSASAQNVATVTVTP